MHKRQAIQWLAVTVASSAMGAALADNEGIAPRQSTAVESNRSKIMSNANAQVVSYIAAWNERDSKRRLELVIKTWADKGSYVDAHRQAQGHAEIDAIIEKAQQQFPGYSLRLASGIEAHNNQVRFSWAAGGSDRAPLYLGGTDFAVTAADGRFLSVAGFVDAARAR
jgi:hypothetical protein